LAVAYLQGGPAHGQTLAVQDSGPVRVITAANDFSIDYTHQIVEPQIGTYNVTEYRPAYWTSGDTSSGTISISWDVATTWVPFSTQVYSHHTPAYAVAPPLTQEEADRRLAAAREQQHKNAVQRKRAIKKGRRLLMTVLTDDQKMEYAKTRSFTVNGEDGKRYRVRKSGTTHELNERGEAAYSHCIHLPYSYVDEDTLIALKLMLENDCKEFRRIANTQPLLREPEPLAIEPRFALAA
jgi:hypothetical protein